eukprot:2773641-Pleurochrysis_carterae.AAC.2
MAECEDTGAASEPARISPVCTGDCRWRYQFGFSSLGQAGRAGVAARFDAGAAASTSHLSLLPLPARQSSVSLAPRAE